MARKKKIAAPVEAETGTATAVAWLPTSSAKAPRKKRLASVKAHVAPVESVDAPVTSSVKEVEPAPFDSVETTPPPSLAVDHPVASSETLEEQPDRPRFRSWTVRTASGYEKFTDTKRGLIVLKFHDRPSEVLLDAVKDAGFKYHPNYEDQGKVWLRKNDFEGRVQVDKIEATLRQHEQGTVAER